MEYKETNGILLPKKKPPSIDVFIDETYLLNRSGLLQSAIPIQRDVYEEKLKPFCRDLLQRLGKGAREFKGSAIKNGNKDIYLAFLQAFVNEVANVADQWPLFPIISIDAMEVYSGPMFDSINGNVRGALKNLGISNEDQLVAEFSRQILWLHIHFKKITQLNLENDFILNFDNKHRYAESCGTNRFVTHRYLRASVSVKLENLLKSMAQTLIAKIEPRIAMPRIGGFRFQWSSNEFGLQAADLLCHLVYNRLKYEMGIVNANTELKSQILWEVMPCNIIDPALRALMKVTRDNEGKDAVLCLDKELRSTIQILPKT